MILNWSGKRRYIWITDGSIFYFYYFDGCVMVSCSFICISLVAIHMKYIFMHLLVICMFSWVECLSLFLIELFAFLC